MLMPHEFIQVARELDLVASSHSFELVLYLAAIRFNVLHVHSSCWVNKFNGVIDSGMC